MGTLSPPGPPQGWPEPQRRQDSPRQRLPCICLQEEEKQRSALMGARGPLPPRGTPHGALPSSTPRLAPRRPHGEAGTSQEGLPPLSPLGYLTPRSPPPPCPPSLSPVRGRMRISSSVRPCSLENWVNLSRRSGASSFVRPAAESGVRGSPPAPPTSRGHAAPGCKGQDHQEGGPNPAISGLGDAAALLLGESSPTQDIPGGSWGGSRGRRTVEQHHGGGAGALGDAGGHQGVLIVVGLHHADVVLAAPAWGDEEGTAQPRTPSQPRGTGDGRAGWGAGCTSRAAPREDAPGAGHSRGLE